MFLIPVRAATTGDITLSGEQTIDGIAIVEGDRVLVKDQIDGAENGVYVAASAGWSRATDFDDTAEVVNGALVPVLEGDTQAESEWLLMTPDPIVVGTTPLEWQIFRDLSAYVTETGTETLSNKTFSGALSFVLDGGRIGITSQDTPIFEPPGLVQILNDNSVGIGLNVRSYWQGSTASPFVNNDCTLFEVFSDTLSNSTNRAWAASCSNAYHKIPEGVTDSGERIGVIGWAGSVANGDYVHAGTLNLQRGVLGTAGFQGAGSPDTAVVNQACGVAGLIYADSEGATMVSAVGGQFVSDGLGLDGTVGTASIIETNYGVYARARNGTLANYSFYGDGGTLYNQEKMLNVGQAAFTTAFSESGSAVTARKGGNSFEFGYPSAGGYCSNIGATQSSGWPFIGFCAEGDPTGNTWRTRGKLGFVISTPLNGELRFTRLENANASGQSGDCAARFLANGQFQMFYSPILPIKTPASAADTGAAGEVCWDANYLYVCVATDTWKRVALSSW
jgi:hypothetical protein